MPLLPLDNADAVVAAAKAQPEVVAAAKRINTGGMISSREGAYPVAITGIEPSVEAPVSIQAENVVDGRYLMDEDVDAIFIGRALADLLDVGVGDRVTLLGRAQHEQMRQRTMTVVGIYDLGVDGVEKGTVFITLPEAQALYDLRDQVTEVTITLQKVGQEKRVVPALKAALPGYEVDSWDTLRPEIRETMDTKTGHHRLLRLYRGLHRQHRHPQPDADGRLRAHARDGRAGRAGHEGPPDHGPVPAGGRHDRRGRCGDRLQPGPGLSWAVAQMGGIDYSFAADMGEITALMGTHLIPTYSL